MMTTQCLTALGFLAVMGVIIGSIIWVLCIFNETNITKKKKELRLDQLEKRFEDYQNSYALCQDCACLTYKRESGRVKKNDPKWKPTFYEDTYYCKQHVKSYGKVDNTNYPVTYYSNINGSWVEVSEDGKIIEPKQ